MVLDFRLLFVEGDASPFVMIRSSRMLAGSSLGSWAPRNAKFAVDCIPPFAAGERRTMISSCNYLQD
jgi:hypothetical protein